MKVDTILNESKSLQDSIYKEFVDGPQSGFLNNKRRNVIAHLLT